MKIVAAGDLHIKERRPENRIDSDYVLAQFDKIAWILDYALKQEAILLLPGDVFDSPTQSNFMLQTFIHLFFESHVSIGVIAGQHDMRYHNQDLGNIALVVLDAAKAVHLIQTPQNFKDVTVYGCSFGQGIPKITTKGFNVLLIHKMIIDSDKVWIGQEDFEYAQNFLRKNDFDLIISGDNHYFFIAKIDKKCLINCGSLTRMTTAQLDHIPRIVLFDTDTKGYEIIDIPVKPISEVFDLSKIEEKEERKKKFDAFIKELKELPQFQLIGGSKDRNITFQDRLLAYIKQNEISDDIKDIIMEAANGKNN